MHTCPGYDNKLHPVVALRRGVNEVNLCYNYLQVTLGQGVVTCMPPRQGYVGAVVHWNALPVKGSSIVVVLLFLCILIGCCYCSCYCCMIIDSCCSVFLPVFSACFFFLFLALDATPPRWVKTAKEEERRKEQKIKGQKRRGGGTLVRAFLLYLNLLTLTP